MSHLPAIIINCRYKTLSLNLEFGLCSYTTILGLSELGFWNSIDMSSGRYTPLNSKVFWGSCSNSSLNFESIQILARTLPRISGRNFLTSDLFLKWWSLLVISSVLVFSWFTVITSFCLVFAGKFCCFFFHSLFYYISKS